MCPISIGTNQSKRTSSSPSTDAGKLWLLLIGVNHYHDPQLPDLSYSAIDCQGLSDALLTATQMFPDKDAQVHHDNTAKLPILEVVQTSIEKIIANARSQDTVLLYFSGHGLQDDQSQQVVLCLADTRKDQLLATGLSLPKLLKDFGRCAARQQLVWLDACHSGSLTLRGTGQTKPVLPNPTSQLVSVLRQKAAQSSGFYALLSCDQDQRSWEFPQLGHGVFTYYLMRGLRGEAVDDKGAISADSLYRYVYYQTLRYIDKTNQQLRLINQQKQSRGDTELQSEYPLQTPKRIVEGVGESILVMKVTETEQRYPRQAILLDGLAETASSLSLSKILRRAGEFELAYWPQANRTWSEAQGVIRDCFTAAVPASEMEAGTVLLYLRGKIDRTESGEPSLVLREGTCISRSWLRQILRHAAIAQHIVILDCPGAQNLADWLEDLQLDSDHGQCLLAAAAPPDEPNVFTQALIDTLTEADPQAGLSVAGWITQLQGRLALSGITPHFWLSGSRGVIEVLPSQPTSRGSKADNPLDIGICPFMGLRSFSENDAAFFFGRDSLVQQLLQVLNREPFLAVVGASGSGKSSVVQAGLVAQLRQGKQIPGSETWWVHGFRPGAQPVQALAKRLVEPNPDSSSKEMLQLEGLLHLGVEGFVRWLRSRPEPMVVLVVDQFEELFTLAAAQERQVFLELILGATKYAGDRFKLVITLRADFVASCLEYPELASPLQRASVLVPPVLSEADYQQIILRPAEKVGLMVEPELVSVLLQDLSQGVGDLPLLEFVLEQIWEHRQPGQLNLNVYQQQVGGLKGSLERKAQAVYEALEPEAQDCARWIFLNLTQLGEGTEDTRRRVAKEDLIVAKYPEALVEQTLQGLTKEKLVVVSVDSEAEWQGKSRGDRQLSEHEQNQLASTLNSEVTVEVAHEILIRHWSTLRWWLEENRTRLRSQRQLEQATQSWLQSDRQADFLLRGVPLDAALELYVNYTDELPGDVQRFVEAGLAAREAEEQLTHRQLRRAQRVIALISALGVGVAGLGGMAYWQQRLAKLQEIETLNALSTAQLSNHQSLEAIASAVQAGQQLQAIPALNWFNPQAGALRLQTAGTLQQSVALTAEQNRLEGHSERVNAIAYSVDGQLLASVSDDGSLKLWRRDGTLLTTLVVDASQADSALNSRALDVTFSPTTSSIAVAQSNGSVTLWQSTGKQQLLAIAAHRDWVTTVAFSPDGQLLATGSRDGTIKLWHSVDGTLLKTFTGHRGWVNTLAWHPDGRTLVSAGEDQALKLWDVTTGQAVWDVIAHDERVTTVAFSPDGQWLASGGGDRLVKLWQLADRQPEIIGEFDDQVNTVAFSPDGTKLLAAGVDRTLQIWQLDTGEPLARLAGHGGAVLDAVWQPDSQAIASASTDKTVRLWQISTPQRTLPELSSLQFSPDGQILVGAAWDGRIELWQRQGNRLGDRLQVLPERGTYVFKLAFSPDQQWLAAAHDDGVVQVWNPEHGSMLYSLDGHQKSVTTVAFSPDSKTLLSGGADRTLRLWELADGAAIKDWLAHDLGVTAVAWQPRQQLIASGSEDKTVKIWDAQGNLRHTLQGHTEAIAALIFSSDGKYLISSAWDNTIKIWRLSDGSLMRTLTGHQNGVTSLAFFPDSRVLLSASTDQTLKLWNFQTGELLKSLAGQEQPIESLSLSPDGKLLISSGTDLQIRLWDWNLENLLGHSCDRLKNYLVTHSNATEQVRCSSL